MCYVYLLTFMLDQILTEFFMSIFFASLGDIKGKW